MVRLLKVSMERHLSNSSGVSLLLRRANTVHLPQASTARRHHRVNLAHHHLKGNTEHHHPRASTELPRHNKDSTVRRHQGNISHLLCSNSMDLQPSLPLGMGRSRQPISTFRGMLRLFARP